ncbi:MAG: hypothetical protein V3U11_11670 [Planctomycetota bacterium]
MPDSEDQGKWLGPTKAKELRQDLAAAAESISNLMKEIRTLMIERDEARKERDDLRRRYSNAIGPR